MLFIFIFSLLFYLINVDFGVRADSLSNDQVAIVMERLAQGAQQSWELGARAQAILELESPSYSTLTVGVKIPPPSSNPPNTLHDVFTIAENVVRNLTDLTSIPRPLVTDDGSSADPASIGVAVLLANRTGQQNGDGLHYAQAAEDQFNYLLLNVSRTSDGAMSHLTGQVQLWSDFVFMVPPFLAYYGVLTENRSAVAEAYTQIQLYRNYLRDDNANGLWKHVVLGEGNDPGHWSTGNGWAAAGMMRVLGTIKNSQYADSFQEEQKNLSSWVLEIQDAMYLNILSNNLFRNYADQDSSFDDASSTALLASTVYRLSLISNIHNHISAAERSRNTLSSPNASGSSNPSTMTNLLHFDDNGWFTPVVDPYDIGNQGSQSPEGQAFVVMMQAAWTDWVNAKGSNSGARSGVPLELLSWGVFCGVVLILFA